VDPVRRAEVIRRYQESDLAAVYDVCVRTAARGGDARGKYQSDDLMPDIFAGPYVFLEPSFAWVLDDGNRAVGYVVGTPDTAAFVRAYRERWIPRLAGRYPVPPDPPVTPDDEMLGLHYRPERMLWPGLAEYPAHLHIDLLPPFQRAGHGRRLMETFFEAVSRRVRGLSRRVEGERQRARLLPPARSPGASGCRSRPGGLHGPQALTARDPRRRPGSQGTLFRRKIHAWRKETCRLRPFSFRQAADFRHPQSSQFALMLKCHDELTGLAAGLAAGHGGARRGTLAGTVTSPLTGGFGP
jgi:GNAT superfamily N-acetyltransferase